MLTRAQVRPGEAHLIPPSCIHRGKPPVYGCVNRMPVARAAAAPMVCLALLLVGLLSLGIAGSPAVHAQAAPVVIEMGERGNEYYFEPKELTIPAGQTRFAFRNAGVRRHNWVVNLPTGQVRTPDYSGGQTAEETFTFPTPGTYEVVCDLPTHAQRGMRMTLTVAAAAAPATAAATPAAGAGAQRPPAAAGATPGRSGAVSPPAAGAATPAGTPYLISLMVHIPSAIAWLGIVLFHVIVVAVPFLTPAQRGALLARPRWLVLITIPLFFVTGVYQTIFNPFGTITSLDDLTRLRTETAYGLALFWKHAFVLASMALTLAVTFWFAPRLIAFADDVRDSAITPSRMPSLLAWANVAACIALLACVAVMVYQLH